MCQEETRLRPDEGMGLWKNGKGSYGKGREKALRECRGRRWEDLRGLTRCSTDRAKPLRNSYLEVTASSSAVAGQALTVSTSFTTLLNLINLTFFIHCRSSPLKAILTPVQFWPHCFIPGWCPASCSLSHGSFCTRDLFLKHRLYHITPYLKSIWVDKRLK